MDRKMSRHDDSTRVCERATMCPSVHASLHAKLRACQHVILHGKVCVCVCVCACGRAWMDEGVLELGRPRAPQCTSENT